MEGQGNPPKNTNNMVEIVYISRIGVQLFSPGKTSLKIMASMSFIFFLTDNIELHKLQCHYLSFTDLPTFLTSYLPINVIQIQ